jgi:hypothetical protein
LCGGLRNTFKPFKTFNRFAQFKPLRKNALRPARRSTSRRNVDPRVHGS